MKKIITLLLFTIVFAANAQHKVAEKAHALFKQTNNAETFDPFTIQTNFEGDAKNTKEFANATFLQINTAELQKLWTEKPETALVHIPYQNEILSLILYKTEILAEGFHVDTNKANTISYNPGVYYRGSLLNDEDALSTLNIFKNEINGIISSNKLGNIVLGKLTTKDNASDYIAYSDADIQHLFNFQCYTRDEDLDIDNNNHSHERSTLDVETTKCVTMYFEIDFEIYSQNNSSTTDTSNWMTGVFNNVQTLYANDGIDVALKSFYIWTTQDPYSGSSSSDYLYQFNDQTPVFDGDVGQLIGIDAGGLGGVAVTIDGLCSDQNFSYSDVNIGYATVPTFSWTVQVITHEFGHLLGSRHTHACVWNGNNTAIDGCGQQAGYGEGNCATGPIPTANGGTIMSYCHLVSGVGINFNNGFGLQPTNAIAGAVDSATCLSTDCINTCINFVSDVTYTNTTTTSATINWVDNSGATSWEISVTPYNSPFTNWQTTTTNSYNAINLNPNSYYKAVIRPICSQANQTSTSRTFIFATEGDTCNDMPFLDTGGTLGNYDDEQTIVRTFVPNTPNSAITVTFTSFALEEDWDYMYVYDGNNENAPSLTPDGLTGYNTPGPFTSTATDGSLTFKFISDAYVVDAGWEATVSCQSTLGLYSEDFIEYSYFPNPTTGDVKVTSPSLIKEVKVYTTTGQLLLTTTPEAMQTTISLGKFATGTYFVQAMIDGTQVNFKVMKY